MEENPYKAPDTYLEAPAGPTRWEAAAWGAKFGGKVGVAIGAIIAIGSVIIKQFLDDKLRAGKPDGGPAVDLIMAVPAIAIIGVFGSVIGAVVCLAFRYKRVTRIENQE